MGDSVSIKKSTLKIIVISVALVIAAFFVGYSLTGGSDSASSIQVSADDIIIGDPDAPVTIIEYSDFSCPFCGAFAGKNQEAIDYLKSNDPTYVAAYPELKRNYIDTGKVKLVYRAFVVHDVALKAAEGAYCSNDQGLFEEYHDMVFDNQDALSVADLESYASQLRGMDADAFNDCLESGKYADAVANDMNEGRAAGVGGTPTFFIGEEMISGAHPYPVFERIIEAELA